MNITSIRTKATTTMAHTKHQSREIYTYELAQYNDAELDDYIGVVRLRTQSLFDFQY
jgi:hypothetical protein